MHPSTRQLPTYHQSSSNSYALLPPQRNAVLPQMSHKVETPYKVMGPCESQECSERKKYLEGELYR